MDQRVSRPIRWRRAINRANNAIRGVLELRSQWITKLEQLREELEDLRAQRTGKSKELSDALANLVSLQSDYDRVPNDVQNFSFEHLREQIPEDEKFPLEDEIEQTLDDVIDALTTLQ
jgi:hypothetical protein